MTIDLVDVAFEDPEGPKRLEFKIDKPSFHGEESDGPIDSLLSNYKSLLRFSIGKDKDLSQTVNIIQYGLIPTAKNSIVERYHEKLKSLTKERNQIRNAITMYGYLINKLDS